MQRNQAYYSAYFHACSTKNPNLNLCNLNQTKNEVRTFKVAKRHNYNLRSYKRELNILSCG